MSIAKPPLRWGLIGLGKLVTTGIAPAIQRSSRATIAACSTRDPAAARAFAQRFDVPHAHEDHTALVNDPTVDAVFVATPNLLRLPVVQAAARAGKPVLCEKPLAMTLDEGRAVVEACRAAGVMLRLGLHLRFEQSLQRIVALLGEGAVGRIIALSVERAAPVGEKAGWRLDVAQGGGVLFDVGVHLLDLVPRLCRSPIVSVSALASPDIDSGKPEETLTVLARLADGVQATVRVTREAPFTGSDLTVIGRDGMLRTGPLRWVDEQRLTVTTAAGAREERVPASDLYRSEIEQFGDDLADGGTRLGTGEDGLVLIAVANAVKQALHERRTVTVAVP